MFFSAPAARVQSLEGGRVAGGAAPLHTGGGPSAVQPRAARRGPRPAGRPRGCHVLTRGDTVEEDLVAASRERHVGELADHHLAEAGAARARVHHHVLDVACAVGRVVVSRAGARFACARHAAGAAPRHRARAGCTRARQEGWRAKRRASRRRPGLISGLGGPQQPTAAYAAARPNTWPASPSAPVPTQRPPWMNLCSTTRVAHASTSGSPSFRSAGLSRSNTMMCSLSRLRWRDAKGYSSS